MAFCPAFHKAPLILNASFGVFFPYTFLYPALFVVLFWLAFLNVSLHSMLFGGSAHVCDSLWQGDFTHNRKQVVNSSIVSPVE